MSSKLVISKPKVPVAFPPPTPLRSYRVKDGDNWWSLQKQFGYRDPWDLIRYNFGTNKPAEVNWYLREYIGCKKVSADGKNYCFSKAATPGIIYLPRRNFKHATGGGGGTGVVLSAEEQKAMDKHVRSQARSALSHAKAIGALAFDVNGFLVTPNDYERVKSLIDKGHIAVAYSSDLGGDASYDAGTDTLYIGDQGLWNKDGFYALIIHEATHAAFDAQGLAIADTVSEIAAYVAQMLYYMVRRPDADAPFTGNPLEDAIFRPAWRYAKHFNDKRLKLIKNDVPPPYKDLVKMTEALLAHEVYKEQFEMSENDFGGLAGYNGIGGTFYE